MPAEKLIWIPVFKRELSFFQVWIADQAFTTEMKKNLGWGFSKTLNICERGVRDSYYSSVDIVRFIHFLNSKLKQDPRFINATNTRLKKYAKQCDIVMRQLKRYQTKQATQDYFKKFLDIFLAMASLYRFPTMVERASDKLKLSKVTILACGRARDAAGKVLIKATGTKIPKLLEYTARHLKLSKDIIVNLSPQEIDELFAGERSSSRLKDLANKRKRLYILLTINEKKDIFYGKKAQYLRDRTYRQITSSLQVNKIVGKAAYPGRVNGKVRVVIYREQWKRLQKGDILVTPMTRLDSVPYLKKIKTIITDEGGITCHAAIVSRELKIPCVIGTKIATRVLKDGDLVEVDANKGVVKILKRAKRAKK